MPKQGMGREIMEKGRTEYSGILLRQSYFYFKYKERGKEKRVCGSISTATNTKRAS